MSKAVVPKYSEFERIVGRQNSRIRRLEINRLLPGAAVAIYTATYSAGAATSWTPDFTSATASVDDIGLTLNGGGVEIPQGWLAVVDVGFAIAKSSAPPTGETIVWSIAAGGGAEVNRQDVMLNVTDQTFAATLPGASGWAATDPLPVTLGVVESILGTEFEPVSAFFSMWAVQLPTAGFPTSGGI